VQSQRVRPREIVGTDYENVHREEKFAGDERGASALRRATSNPTGGGLFDLDNSCYYDRYTTF